MSVAREPSVRRLRVAFVAPSLGILGGQAVQADRLLSAWRDDPEVDAWLVPVNPPPPPPLRAARRVKYLRTIVTEAIYLPLLVREIGRADVVHVFSASYSSFLLAPLPALVAAKLLGKPVVLNYRSGQAPDHLERSAVARAAVARAEVNVVPSQFLVDVFRGFGVEASIVPNIVNLDRFRFRTRDPLRPRLLSTRNFDELYNVGATIRAFRLVQDRRPDATLALVGGGPQRVQLEALVRDLKLRHVTFAGQVAPDDIPRWYAENDVYIQSPDIDNMPTSVAEAFASGLPVVSTEAGGVPAILTHGHHGLLAGLADYETLAAHVLRLLNRPDEARALARAGFERCQAWTWPRVRDLWLLAYRRAIASRAEASTATGPTRGSASTPGDLKVARRSVPAAADSRVSPGVAADPCIGPARSHDAA